MRDPFKNWTIEQFEEQERISLERAHKYDGTSALHFTNAAIWRQRINRMKGDAT